MFHQMEGLVVEHGAVGSVRVRAEHTAGHQDLDGEGDALCRQIDDFCYGYKLPGAGGGGFMYMVAKDAEAAARIKQLLTDHPLTTNSRFIDMSISRKGLQVSRS